MNDDEKFWTSTRHWKHFEDRKYFNMLIDRIEALRDQTDPAKGDASAVGKDLAVFQALRIAGDLVEALVGWAVAHQVGLAAAGLEFVPLGPGGGHREQPHYTAARAAVDDHRHEELGDRLIRGSEAVVDTETGEQSKRLIEPDPLTARRAAIGLLHANPGAIPHSIANGLVEALRAVEIKDVRPILQPMIDRKGAGYVEMELQLQALCLAQFRYAADILKKGEAWEEVALAYGLASETVRGWSKELRKETKFGQLKVSRMVAFANNSGEQIKVLAKTDRFKALTEYEGDREYGKQALIDAGRKYKAELLYQASLGEKAP